MTKKTGYVALARKYRPQTFTEVLGQPAVSVTLVNALGSRRIHHAYLFTGPRGVGKTTMARILAKALNCVKGPTAQPCGECDPCREITASSSLDVLEMDAASHTGVENVREVIIETVALAPSRDRYKIFIIDEAHMLSTAAFNALLKTLEEPPPHVVFVLATTELAKVPATIASRCQRFRFRPIPVDGLKAHLADLAAKEKIPASPAALELLARSADGSLRDAVSLLDQCRSFTDGEVTVELVREMFGFVPEDILLGLAQALAGADAAVLGGWLKKVYEEGVEPAHLLRDLRAGLQDVYLERVGLAGRTDQRWSKVFAGISGEHLRFLLERVNKTLEDLRQGDSQRLVLELGLFGCLEAAGDLTEWVKRLEDLERRLVSGAAPAAAARTAYAPAPASAPAPAPVTVVTAAPKPAPQPAATPVAGPLAEFWPRLIAAVREERPAVAAALEAARPVAMPDGSCKVLCARLFDMQQITRAAELIKVKLAALGVGPVAFKAEVDAARADSNEVVDPEVPEQAGGSPDDGVWQDVTQPDAKPAKGPSSLSRAEKILGGSTRFVKKKPAA